MKVAILGATGTSGEPTVRAAQERGHEVVPLSRSAGVDVVSGEGLDDALAGVDAVIDASMPPMGTEEQATRNLLKACERARVSRLVFLSIAGIHDPAADAFDYYVAKRTQEDLIRQGPVSYRIVKSAQWMEFATNPAAVQFNDDEVDVADWLIQPVAVAEVGRVLVEELTAEAGDDRYVAGPQQIRLPDLTRGYLRAVGDQRDVRSVPADPAAFGEGVLLGPEQAELVGPDVSTWLAQVGRRVVSAGRDIKAQPKVLFDLIADPSNQPLWDGNENLEHAAEGQRVTAVGDVFVMRLTSGEVRENHVVEFEEGRRIAWRPSEPGEAAPGHLWRWELEATPEGVTHVTHTYDWSQLDDPDRIERAKGTTEEKLRASLDRLARVAEG